MTLRAALVALLAFAVPLPMTACGSAGITKTDSGGDDKNKDKGKDKDKGGKDKKDEGPDKRDPGDPDKGKGDPRAPNHGSPLGINLSEVVFYGSEYPFVDCFRASMPFLHQDASNWDLKEPLDLRPDGYPGSLKPGRFAGTLIFREIGDHYPAGKYVCLYEGDGDIDFDFAGRVVERAPGRLVVDVSPQDAGIYMKITRTDPSNPVRNVRLIMPGHEDSHDTDPFHPEFLKRWKTCKVLRFMDWGRTNNSDVRHWSERTRPDYQTQGTESGVAFEYMIELANELKADPWICIPHQADDDYVRRLAKLVENSLSPKLKVHVEYSNEVWNPMFRQAGWCEQEGLRRGLSNNAYEARLRFYSMRAVEVFRIFKAEFGDSADQRLVRVLASQNANPWTGTVIMDWGRAFKEADALAVAPYFGYELGDPKTQHDVAKMSVEQVLARCSSDIDATLALAAQNIRNAGAREIDLIAYEGGQHLVGFHGAENNQKLTDLFIAANRTEQMGRLYDRYLAEWQRLGGGMFVAFQSCGKFTKWGSWGAFQFYDQKEPKDLAKYEAMMAFVRNSKKQP